MKTSAIPPIDPAKLDRFIGLVRAGLAWALAFIAAFETFGMPKSVERWLRKHLIVTRFAVAGPVMMRAALRGAQQNHSRQRLFHGQCVEPGDVRRRAVGSALRKALRAHGLKASFAKLAAALDNLDALTARFIKHLGRGARLRFCHVSPALHALLLRMESQQRASELVEGSAAPPFS